MVPEGFTLDESGANVGPVAAEDDSFLPVLAGDEASDSFTTAEADLGAADSFQVEGDETATVEGVAGFTIRVDVTPKKKG